MITNNEIENEIKKVSLWACFIHGFASREEVYFARLRKKLVTLVTEDKKNIYDKSAKSKLVVNSISSKSHLGKKPEQHLQVNQGSPKSLTLTGSAISEGIVGTRKESEQTGFVMTSANKGKKTSSILDKLSKDDIDRWTYGIRTTKHEKMLSRKFGKSFVYAVEKDLRIDVQYNAQSNAKVNTGKQSNIGCSLVELDAEIQRGIKKVWGARSFFRGRSKKFLYVEDMYAKYAKAGKKSLNDREKLIWQVMLKDETCARTLKEVCGKDYNTFLVGIKTANVLPSLENKKVNVENKKVIAVSNDGKVDNQNKAKKNYAAVIEACIGNNKSQEVVRSIIVGTRATTSIIQDDLNVGRMNNIRGLFNNFLSLDLELPAALSAIVYSNKKPPVRKTVIKPQAKIDIKENADENRTMAIEVWGRELPIVIAPRGCDNKKQFAQEEVVERQAKVDKEKNVDKPDIEFARKGRFLDVPEINKYLDKLDDAVVLFQFEIKKACTDAISSQGAGPDQDKNISVIIKIKETMLNLASIAENVMRINLFASCENAASIQYDVIIGEIKSKFDKVCDAFSVKESDLSIPIGFLDLDFNEVLNRGRQSYLNLGEVPVDAVKDLSVIKAAIAWLEKLFCKKSARIEETVKQVEEIDLPDDDIVVNGTVKQVEEIDLPDDDIVVVNGTVKPIGEIVLTDDDVVGKEGNMQTNAASVKDLPNNNVNVSAVAGSNAHISEVLAKSESNVEPVAKANSDSSNISPDTADIAHMKDGLWQQPRSPFTPSKSNNKRREAPSSPSRTTRERDVLCHSPCKTAAVIKGIV
jgi:hypothetical protein